MPKSCQNVMWCDWSRLSRALANRCMSRSGPSTSVLLWRRTSSCQRFVTPFSRKFRLVSGLCIVPNASDPLVDNVSIVMFVWRSGNSGLLRYHPIHPVISVWCSEENINQCRTARNSILFLALLSKQIFSSFCLWWLPHVLVQSYPIVPYRPHHITVIHVQYPSCLSHSQYVTRLTCYFCVLLNKMQTYL